MAWLKIRNRVRKPHRMSTLGSTFIAALLLVTALRAWLALRQVRHVLRHRDQVPEPFETDIDIAAHRKAADYTAAKARFSLVGLALDTALALVWTFGGGLALLDDAWRGMALGSLHTGVAVMGSYFLINALIGLPLGVYFTFGIEAEFGFNRTTVRTYILDRVKLLLLSVLLGAPLAYAALALMLKSGAGWWLYVWALWFGFSLALTWAYPVFIAPLFNKFSPLADAGLKARIEALLRRCGFESRGVFVMDGSSRSAHGNAYFTGFGRNKRIVFFDTLMTRLAADEIEAVLAHELGHFRLRHVLQRLALSAV